MNFRTAFKYSVLFAVALMFSTTAKAVRVSDKQLKEVEALLESLKQYE